MVSHESKSTAGEMRVGIERGAFRGLGRITIRDGAVFLKLGLSMRTVSKGSYSLESPNVIEIVQFAWSKDGRGRQPYCHMVLLADRRRIIVTPFDTKPTQLQAVLTANGFDVRLTTIQSSFARAARPFPTEWMIWLLTKWGTRTCQVISADRS